MDHIWYQFIHKAIRQKTQIVSRVSNWHFSSVGVLTKYSSSQETHLGCAESILTAKPIHRSQYSSKNSEHSTQGSPKSLANYNSHCVQGSSDVAFCPIYNMASLDAIYHSKVFFYYTPLGQWFLGVILPPGQCLETVCLLQLEVSITWHLVGVATKHSTIDSPLISKIIQLQISMFSRLRNLDIGNR